jgi:hypothetical protein
MSRGAGYIFLALGTGGLASLSQRFRRASGLSWAALTWLLVSVWLFDLLGVGDPITGEDAISYLAVHALIDCLLVWALFGGIGEYATVHGCHDLALRASRLRAAYVVFVPVTSLSQQVVLSESSGILAVPLLIGIIAWLVWLVMALHLVHRVRVTR